MSNNNCSIIKNIITIMIILPVLMLNAQSKKSEVNEKIKNIKGDVEKITITADGKEYTFSGDEAEKIFKKIKTEKHKEVLVNVLEGKHGDGNVWITDGGDDINLITVIEDEYEFETEEELEDGQKVKKEIKVEIEDGEKKVEVVTTKDGKETTEVFEGEEAEEFLKKSKHNKHFNVHIYDDEDKDIEWVSEGEANMIFLSEELDGDEDTEKKVEVNIEDGIKKVTVTTTKDGKEEVKTYEEDEADEYLKKMKHGKHRGYKFFNSNDDMIIIDKGAKHKRMKKIIIKKKKDDDDKKQDDE